MRHKYTKWRFNWNPLYVQLSQLCQNCLFFTHRNGIHEGYRPCSISCDPRSQIETSGHKNEWTHVRGFRCVLQDSTEDSPKQMPTQRFTRNEHSRETAYKPNSRKEDLHRHKPKS